MYLKTLRLKNIKCFAELEIDFSKGDNVRLWTTLFGRNGVGKSTLLQAMGAVLAGPSAVRELLPVPEGWVRKGAKYGEIYAEVLWTEKDATKQGQKRKNKPYVMQYLVGGGDPANLPDSLDEKPSVVELVPWSGSSDPKWKSDSKRKEALTKDRKLLAQTAYTDGQGWMACGYGPFRRLSGGSEASNSIVAGERRAAHFVTLFKEDAALTNATKWLTDLHNTAREGDEVNARILETVKKTFVEKLFPEQTELIVTAKSALLQRGGKTEILFQDLSDGYRSMLALTVDLLRWLVKAFPNDANPLQCPGVVLIDELDTHLHPSWQRTIGFWLREKFPKIQFIIATHSPFIAQVSDAEPEAAATESDLNSTDDPGNIHLSETDDGVKARPSHEQARLLSPEQILLSELFEMESVMSPPLDDKIRQFQQLHAKKKGGGLNGAEQSQYDQLSLVMEQLPLSSRSDDRAIERALHEKVDRHGDVISSLK
jgi:energy-coupling factor transporter ATP-binding protein EcfA2